MLPWFFYKPLVELERFQRRDDRIEFLIDGTELLFDIGSPWSRVRTFTRRAVREVRTAKRLGAIATLEAIAAQDRLAAVRAERDGARIATFGTRGFE